MTEDAWRDGLAGLEGVEVRTLALEAGEGGRRTLRLRLRFRHLRDLLRWELFARRDLAVRALGPQDKPSEGELVMRPLARIPYRNIFVGQYLGTTGLVNLDHLGHGCLLDYCYS